MSHPTSRNTTAIVLSGGEGRRMGGQDKGWLAYQGVPLIEQVLARLAPQVNHLMISANRNIPAYRQLGFEVFQDQRPFLGPLGGIESCLSRITTDYAAVVAVDTPAIPVNFVEQLYQALPAKLVLCESQGRLQPLLGLYHQSLVPSIQRFLSDGDRKLMLWCKQQSFQTVALNSDEPFVNLNTPADFSKN